MSIDEVLARVVRYLRAGYPAAAPRTGYVPLFALLPRRLSDDEILAVAARFMSCPGLPVVGLSIGVAITEITDELPSPQDVERVRRRLLEAGGRDIDLGS